MTDVMLRGPLFDGRTEAAIAKSCQEIQDQVAAQASADLHMWMDQYFQHPTPYYETQVITEHRADTTVITDQGIIYGPWLAGISERNLISRFKGYAHWRLAVQGAKERAPELIAAVFAAHAGEI